MKACRSTCFWQDCLAKPKPPLAMEDDESLCDIEIVGLHATTNGRTCTAHECCGRIVVKGSVIRLVECIVERDGNDELAVKCVLVNADGVDTCTVGFVPRIYVQQGKVKDHLNKFVVVKELYNNSDNTYKRSVSHRNLGAAAASFLDENEGRNE